MAIYMYATKKRLILRMKLNQLSTIQEQIYRLQHQDAGKARINPLFAQPKDLTGRQVRWLNPGMKAVVVDIEFPTNHEPARGLDAQPSDEWRERKEIASHRTESVLATVGLAAQAT